ncbi:hypothetical protein HMPREF3282_07260 [Staphylococcus sp. HMSC73C01]|nr:hypothetical protein HMPREF3282_07260 [Staphylococcus sp. HMSC73C01]
MHQAFLRATQAGVGPSAQRNAPSISTDNASWGGALSTEKCTKHFYGQRKLGWAHHYELP